MRKLAISGLLVIILAAISILFWRNEWIYNLPTPVPKNYNIVNINATIALPAYAKRDNSKPMFLHFFNPSCPCSRFNMDHFKSIVAEYDKQVDFAIVVLSGKTYSEAEIQKRFQLTVPVYFDSSIAASCGVYSTPQAVILSQDKMFYRGNYNKSRYCADRKTEYARMALDSLLQNKHDIHFDEFALKAYGCTLPKCTKQ